MLNVLTSFVVAAVLGAVALFTFPEQFDFWDTIFKKFLLLSLSLLWGLPFLFLTSDTVVFNPPHPPHTRTIWEMSTKLWCLGSISDTWARIPWEKAWIQLCVFKSWRCSTAQPGRGPLPYIYIWTCTHQRVSDSSYLLHSFILTLDDWPHAADFQVNICTLPFP